jgi:hypothetical protein
LTAIFAKVGVAKHQFRPRDLIRNLRDPADPALIVYATEVSSKNPTSISPRTNLFWCFREIGDRGLHGCAISVRSSSATPAGRPCRQA